MEATAGSDFVAASGILIIPAGEVEGNISVQVLADAPIEPPERLQLVLSNPLRASLAQNSVPGTITDPRHMPVIEREDDILGGPGGVTALVQPSDVVVSPDGAQLYAVSDSGDAVLQFQRDDVGALSFVRSYTSATPGFEAAKLDGPRDTELSSDGRFAYVAARNSNAINVFSRDPGNGDLGLLQVLSNNQADATAAGGTVRGLNGAAALALTPDGAHLSAVAGIGNSLATFARHADTGLLVFVEVETNGVDDPTDAGAAVVALDRPSGLAVSRDGGQVYVASRFGNALLVFGRDSDSQSEGYGRLVYRTSHRDGLLGIEGLGGPSRWRFRPTTSTSMLPAKAMTHWCCSTAPAMER